MFLGCSISDGAKMWTMIYTPWILDLLDKLTNNVILFRFNKDNQKVLYSMYNYFLTLLGVEVDIEEFPESSFRIILYWRGSLFFSDNSIHDLGLIFPRIHLVLHDH